ncbi:hypothetical protein AAY473_011939 [Plecturocebus cupreus]
MLCILVETGFHHVAQAGLEFLSSGNLPASASEKFKDPETAVGGFWDTGLAMASEDSDIGLIGQFTRPQEGHWQFHDNIISRVQSSSQDAMMSLWI